MMLKEAKTFYSQKVRRLGFNPTSRNWNIKTKLENVA